jgi:hypothetical protein
MTAAWGGVAAFPLAVSARPSPRFVRNPRFPKNRRAREIPLAQFLITDI